MNPRLVYRLFIACLMGLIPIKLHGSMLSPSPLCGTNIESPGLKVGSEVALSLRCSFTAPINVEYHLPLDIESVSLSGDGKPELVKTETENILRWERPADSRGSVILRFKLMKPSFHKMYGRISVGNIDQEWLTTHMLNEVNRLPSYAGTDERTKLYRSQYLNKPEDVIKGFQSYASSQFAFDNNTHYIRVSKDSGRIENWDFSSLGNRISHYLRSKLGYHGENLSGLLLALAFGGIVVLGVMTLGVSCIKAFIQKPSTAGIIMFIIGIFLLTAPILFFGVCLKKYLPMMFSPMQ